MFSIIVKKRTLVLAVLVAVGLLLLILGWKGISLIKKNPDIEAQVSRPAIGVTGFESVGPPLFGENKPEGPKIGAASKEDSDFFVEYRLERDRARGQRVEWLKEVIDNNNSAGETRQKAQEGLMDLSRGMEKEVELENLLRAKGYNDAAVSVGDRAVNVIVASSSLSEGEIAQINGLVSRGTGMDTQNIVIIPTK
ncbi:MAG: SpoIIIAH-like family protein [Desulfotomaculaceae bacterium]|nr:SpoIIIAH-like family protein [Desulfotomaculaceae bacterium]